VDFGSFLSWELQPHKQEVFPIMTGLSDTSVLKELISAYHYQVTELFG
jgi:hypothetical protein